MSATEIKKKKDKLPCNACFFTNPETIQVIESNTANSNTSTGSVNCNSVKMRRNLTNRYVVQMK